ncbi:MAG: lipopolysaccharide transport periplasmic protein LptA [Gallionella sp.]
MTTSFAERADRDQPVNLEADRVTVDDLQQVSTFTGNVRLSQGSLLILGDKIVVENDKEGFIQVSAHGNPASFKQKREGLESFVEGYGEIIEYDANTETIMLHIQARFIRDFDEITGENITYNAKTEIFRVNSIEIEPENSIPQRVRAVLQPNSKQVAPAPEVIPEKSTDAALPEN